MKHYVDAVRQALANANWYAALTLSLTLPDICGRLENPHLKSQKRYVDWCERYLTPQYTRRLRGGTHVFLGGQDCYALRCAFLHEGRDDLTGQAARRALEAFMFIAPPAWGSAHCNQSNLKLQLQVDMFCEDICLGVEKWMTENGADREVRGRIGELMQVWDTSDGLAF